MADKTESSIDGVRTANRSGSIVNAVRMSTIRPGEVDLHRLLG